MGKKKKKKIKIPKKYKLSKKLPPWVYHKYMDVGFPNDDFPKEEYLDMFRGALGDDIKTLCHHPYMGNHDKMDILEEWLCPIGFEVIGAGNNLEVFAHPQMYPGVVFKIALDIKGLSDNKNDAAFSEAIEQYARYIIGDEIGYISVQEYYPTMIHEGMGIKTDKNRQCDYYRDDILEFLKNLSKDYLLCDMGPHRVYNYGIKRNGDFVVIDGSDMFPLDQMDEPRCNRIIVDEKKTKKKGKLTHKYCKGKVKYNEDYTRLICQTCSSVIDAIELRPSTTRSLPDEEMIIPISHEHYMNLHHMQKRMVTDLKAGIPVYEIMAAEKRGESPEYIQSLYNQGKPTQPETHPDPKPAEPTEPMMGTGAKVILLDHSDDDEATEEEVFLDRDYIEPIQDDDEEEDDYNDDHPMPSIYKELRDLLRTADPDSIPEELKHFQQELISRHAAGEVEDDEEDDDPDDFPDEGKDDTLSIGQRMREYYRKQQEKPQAETPPPRPAPLPDISEPDATEITPFKVIHNEDHDLTDEMKHIVELLYTHILLPRRYTLKLYDTLTGKTVETERRFRD